MYDIVVHLL